MANYPQYPQAAQPSEPPGPPSSIVNAVRLMYAGAAVQAISVIVSLATIHSLKTIIEQRNPTFDATRVNRLVNATVVLVIVFGLIGIGLWLWMAWANRRGRSWARIVSTVFFGLASIGLLIGFTQAATVVSRIISIVSWAIGLAAIVFLWQRQSSDYYDARKQAVYAPLPYEQPGPPGQPYGQLFFFNDTATTEIYTLSLHDALPISSTTPSMPSTTTSSPRRSGCVNAI